VARDHREPRLAAHHAAGLRRRPHPTPASYGVLTGHLVFLVILAVRPQG
jgi:hypothetical protein